MTASEPTPPIASPSPAAPLASQLAANPCSHPSFEVAGVPGAAAVQGLGIAFLMWNATYPAVIASPLRFRAVAVIVLVQQAIGLAGESWLRFGLPAGHAALSASIERFILFDAAGLVLMAAAFGWLLWVKRATPQT